MLPRSTEPRGACGHLPKTGCIYRQGAQGLGFRACRALGYGLFQHWLCQEAEDDGVAGGPENLCCYLKKQEKKKRGEKKKKISLVLVVRQRGFEKRLPCHQRGSACQSG